MRWIVGGGNAVSIEGLGARILPAIDVLEEVKPQADPIDEFNTIGVVVKSSKVCAVRWTYLPDGSGRVHKYFAPEIVSAGPTQTFGPATEYFYDAGANEPATGLATGVKLPGHALRSRTRYDERGDAVRSTPPGLASTTYVRDALGRVTLTIEPPSGGNAAPTTITGYDKDSNVESVKLPNGALTEYTHDLLGRRVVVFDLGVSPARIAQTFYDRRGNVRLAEDFKDQGVETVYNELSWPLETKYRDGSRVSYTYDPNGNQRTMTEVGAQNPSRKTEHFYDARNNRELTEYPDQTTGEKFIYNLDDLVTASGTLHDGKLVSGVRTQFNARHLVELTTEIDPGDAGSPALLNSPSPPGPRTRRYYDARANLRAVEDHLQHVTQTTYDGDDRPVESIDARGKCAAKRTYTEFNAVHQVLVPDPVSGGDELTVTRTNEYTARGELMKAKDANVNEVTLGRDANGWVTDVFDQDLKQTHLARNPRGWVTQRVNDHSL